MMEFKEPNHSLLARYLDGKCTEREREMVEGWVAEHPDNAQKLREFKQVWQLAGIKSNSKGAHNTLEQEWQQLRERLNEKGRGRAQNSPVVKHQTPWIHSSFQKIVRVAAIFLIAGICGIVAYSYWSASQSETGRGEPILREVSTSVAQRANLTLGDGTKVILNADSKMEFPQTFAPDIREVSLQGEAYFNVERDPDKPFIVRSGGTVTRVLGTSFVIRSYSEEQQVQVVVEQGRVSFKSTADSSSNLSILHENELGKYLASRGKVVTASVEDMELYLGWKEGILKFRQASMRKVAREIERRYGVKVNFEQENIADMSLTAFLKSRSIRNVLDVIATSLTINYRLENNEVIFY